MEGEELESEGSRWVIDARAIIFNTTFNSVRMWFLFVVSLQLGSKKDLHWRTLIKSVWQGHERKEVWLLRGLRHQGSCKRTEFDTHPNSRYPSNAWAQWILELRNTRDWFWSVSFFWSFFLNDDFRIHSYFEGLLE